MLETKESITEIDSHRVAQASEFSDRVIKRVPGNLSSQARWVIIVVHSFQIQERFLSPSKIFSVDFIELQSRNFISYMERKIRIGTIISESFVNILSVYISRIILVNCLDILFNLTESHSWNVTSN